MPKYKGYNKLSEGGTKYLDLSDPNIFKQLTPREKLYVEHQMEWYKELVRVPKAEYYDTLSSDIERNEAIKRQRYILTGKSEEDSIDIYFQNYVTGLAARGEARTAQLLDYAVSLMSTMRGKYSFYQDLPDLTLFYADKRSKTGRSWADLQTVGSKEETYADVFNAIESRLRKSDIPKYVIDFMLQGGYDTLMEELSQKGKSLKDVPLDALKNIAKNARS